MANEKLLLVDDDNNLLDLLQTVFQKENYRVLRARNGNEALQALEDDAPDLILLDLVLPDLDGYSLLEKIKANPDWRFIPVIIVSSKQDLEDKLKGLHLGVMDYVTKPFERAELLARVRNILDFYKLKFQKRDSRATKSTYQRLIDFMRERGIKSLVPRIRKDAKLGYEYPEAAKILNPEELGGEIYALESMAKAKLFERVFFDAVHICPSCGHHDLNFREICSHCDSADIATVKLITHTNCGYRGLEDKFTDGDGLRCPECGDALHAPGEDHEVGTSALHVCNSCEAEFTDPIVNCRCMNCDCLFDVSSALTRKVYAYRFIAGRSDMPWEEPPQEDTPNAAKELIAKVQSLQIEFVGMDGFARQAQREILRAQKETGGVSLIGLQFKGLASMRPQNLMTIDLFTDSVLSIFKNVLRNYDVLTLRDSFEWLVLLPETPFRIAKILAERLKNAIDHLDFDVEYTINMASFPEDGESARELLEVLSLGIVNFHTL